MPLTNFHLSTKSRRILTALVPVVCEPDAANRDILEPILANVELSLRSFPVGPRSVIVVGIKAFNIAAVLHPPFGRTFSHMPPWDARCYYHSWWSSPLYVLRRLARALKGLLVLGYYEQEVAHRKLRYYPEQWIAHTTRRRLDRWSADIQLHDQVVLAPDPLVPATLSAPPIPAAQKLPRVVCNRHDVPGGDLACDVVVVGSGAGGAVIASELAEGGLDVIVLEEGGYHRSEEFTTEATAMVRKL